MSEAREIAEYQLEQALRDVLISEFEACWNRLKADSAVSDPEAEMSELAEWFAEQVQTAITELIEQEPDDDEDDLDEDDDESDEDDETDDEYESDEAYNLAEEE